jgi:drug/metabolite transporter (DMT)-like permease
MGSMHNALTIAVLAGLGGMFGWGAADFFAKKAIDRNGPIKALVWGHGFGSFLLLVIMLAEILLGGQVTQPRGLVWLGLAGFGALQMIIYWLLYQGFEKGLVSVLNPIFASFSGIVALVAIIWFGEHASLLIGLAFILIFIGIIAINLDWSDIRRKKLKGVPGLKEVATATVLAAGWTLGWDKFVSGHDSLSYAVWMYLAMTVAAICLAQFLKNEIRQIESKTWPFVALVGSGEALAYLAITWGYSSTPLTGVVALISGTFSVPTVILAYIFLKERLTKLQLAGIVAIILGIAGVSVG